MRGGGARISTTKSRGNTGVQKSQLAASVNKLGNVVEKEHHDIQFKDFKHVYDELVSRKEIQSVTQREGNLASGALPKHKGPPVSLRQRACFRLLWPTIPLWGAPEMRHLQRYATRHNVAI